MVLKTLETAQLIGEGEARVIGRRQNVIPTIQDLRSGAYTLHHILPYRYPAFFGYLAEQFQEHYLGNRTIEECRSDQDKLISSFGSFVHMLRAHNANAQGGLVQRFAWMGPNLFEGPAPIYRVDDPGSEKEASMPLSMLQSAYWDPLDLLKTAIDGVVTFSGDGAGEISVQASVQVTLKTFATLLRIMSPVIDRQHGNALKFNADDWLCMENPNWAARGRPTRDQFRLVVNDPRQAAELRYYRPVVDDGAGPMFWRLRTNADAFPPDTKAVRAM
jgi:hypothetical protein